MPCHLKKIYRLINSWSESHFWINETFDNAQLRFVLKNDRPGPDLKIPDRVIDFWITEAPLLFYKKIRFNMSGNHIFNTEFNFK